MLPSAQMLSMADSLTCQIEVATGSLYCWGKDVGNGAFGIGVAAVTSSIPQWVAPGTQWTSVFTSGGHTCGIMANASLYCWGANNYGQLGDNSTTQRLRPTAVSGGATWASLPPHGFSDNGYHTCAIRADASLWCWGLNNYGQVGVGSAASTFVLPTQVNTSAAWQSVAIGDIFTCAIDGAYRLYCWGQNAQGQLGAGLTVSTSRVPVEAYFGGYWVALDLGMQHGCGIRTDKSLWCWGQNNYAQLGDGTTTPRSIPVLVDKGPWAVISLGKYSSCALTTAGNMSCWGFNGQGLLGLGTTASPVTSPTPTNNTVPLGTIGVGLYASCAVAGTPYQASVAALPPAPAQPLKPHCWGRASQQWALEAVCLEAPRGHASISACPKEMSTPAPNIEHRCRNQHLPALCGHQRDNRRRQVPARVRCQHLLLPLRGRHRVLWHPGHHQEALLLGGRQCAGGAWPEQHLRYWVPRSRGQQRHMAGGRCGADD